MGKKLTGAGDGGITFLNPEKNLFEGDVVEGHFIETRERKGKYGMQKNHYFRDVNGSMFSISGSGQINKALASVAPNTAIRVEYLGKREIKTGQWKGGSAISFDIEDLTSDVEAGYTLAPLSTSTAEDKPKSSAAKDKLNKVAQAMKEAKGQ